MTEKRILFISSYFAPEPTGVGKYNGEMIDYLAGNGHQCTVIVPYPYYPFWKVQEPYVRYAKWYKTEVKSASGKSSFKIHRCPQYVPKNPTGKLRMLQDLSFCVSVAFKMFAILFHKKYDYVITVAPSSLIGIMAVWYKRIRGAKFIYHIQDLQIDAARDLNMIKSPWIIKTLLSIEKHILTKADIISTISEGMAARIATKCNRNVVLFPNWVDTDEYFPIQNKAGLKEKFGFSSSNIIYLYSGAIGEKQGLEAILIAAKEVEENKEIRFIICGTGPYKEKLQAIAKEMQLTNVSFLPLQAKDHLNEFLNMADVHLVLQKANASDLVMPSKLTPILSIGGLAIVAAGSTSSLYKMITANNIGILIEPENQVALTKAIRTAVTGRADNILKNAREFAVNKLGRDRVLGSILHHLQ